MTDKEDSREKTVDGDQGGTRRVLAAYGTLALFGAALLWPLVRGQALYWGDLIVYFEPMADYAKVELRQGRIPLWNPYVLGGQPYIGNPQMAIFYPATLLFCFLPTWLAFSVALGTHLFLCGAFTFAYLRRWTPSLVSALAGGMVYMGSACLLGRLQFPPMIYSAAYLPLLLLLADRQVDTPRLTTGVGSGVAFGLMVLAAHTQMAYFETLLVAAYLAARLWRRCQIERPERGQARRVWWIRRLTPFLLSGLLGAWLCAVQLVPAAQLLLESPREEMTAVQANRFFLEARQLLTLVVPHFVGHPAQGDYHAAGNAWEPALFIGWVPLVCIGFALTKWKARRVTFWIVTAGLGIWLAFGIKGGLYPVAFALVPGLNKFHDPARFLYFTTFGFAALTALGLDGLREKEGVRCWVSGKVSGVGCWVLGVGVILAIGLPMVWFGQEWNPTTKPRNLNHRPAIMEGVRHQVLGVREKEAVEYPTPNTQHLTPKTQHLSPDTRFYLPEYEALWRRFISYYDYGRNDARTLAAFQDTVMPNMGMRWGIESLDGYEPVPLYAPFAMEGATAMALERGEPNATRLMGMLNAGVLLLPVGMNVTDPRLIPLTPERSVGGMKAWRNVDSLPRAWLVRKTRRVEGRTRIEAALTSPDFEPAQTAILSFGANDALAEQAGGLEWNWPVETTETPEAPVTFHTRSPGELVMQANAGNRSAFLVVSVMAYPGWQASVDGRAQSLVRADGALMGLPLASGMHRVVFRYEPGAYRVGLYLSLLACGVVSLAAGCAVGRRGRDIRTGWRM